MYGKLKKWGFYILVNESGEGLINFLDCLSIGNDFRNFDNILGYLWICYDSVFMLKKYFYEKGKNNYELNVCK